MVVKTNNPREKARELQRTLFKCAKRSSTRRFHALYDRIFEPDNLKEAWRRVRSNRGAAGIDGETIDAIEEAGVEQFLAKVAEDLRTGSYRPSPARRRWIPKGDGKQRPLNIPTVRDRVVQMATKIVIEPIFEADFLPCSYGFRPRKKALDAKEAVREAGNRGYDFVLDADIRDYFGSIDQKVLLSFVAARISDRRVLKLIRKWLEAGVMEDGTIRETLAGTPQGGVISPLLANIYLHRLDHLWAADLKHLGVFIRYADDFVVMCGRESQAHEARRRIEEVLARLGLTLHPDKTRIVSVRDGKGSFVFLGCTFRKKRSILRNPRKRYMQRWPSPKAMKKIRSRIHDETDARRSGVRDVNQLIARLNPVLRGWGNYFRTGNADHQFNRLDDYVYGRIWRWMWRRGGQRPGLRRDDWPRERLHGYGLHRLRGSVRYPTQATLVKTTGKPDAGNPHVRFERGIRKRAGINSAPRR